MAVKTSGGLRTVSWSVTTDQYEDITAEVRQAGSHQRVSQSDVARDRLALAQTIVSHGRNIGLTASDVTAIVLALTPAQGAWLKRRAERHDGDCGRVVACLVNRVMYAEPHFDEEVA